MKAQSFSKNTRGYTAATERLDKGEDPKELLRQAQSDMDADAFTRGWIEACENRIRWQATVEMTKVSDARLFKQGYEHAQTAFKHGHGFSTDVPAAYHAGEVKAYDEMSKRT